MSHKKIAPITHWIKTYILISCILIFLTTVATFPLIKHFGSTIPGNGGDVYINSWFVWWFEHAIVSLKQSPFTTNYQFYPLTINLAQDISIIHGILSAPITHFFGFFAGYNFIIFFTHVVTGIGLYIFIKLFVSNGLAAFLGSIIFTFSYYRSFRAMTGHIDVASTEWFGFALYFICLLFIFNQHRKKYILGASFFLALCAYTEYRNFLYLSLFIGVIFIISIITDILEAKKGNLSNTLLLKIKSLAKTILVTTLFMSPIIVLNINKLSDVVHAPFYSEFNANILSFLLPPCNTLISKILQYCYASPSYEGGIVYLGIVPMLLALLFIFLKRNSTQNKILFIFGGCFVIFFVLSLGSQTPIYPWLFDYLTPIKILRVPSRFVVLLEVILALFSSYTLAYIFNHSIHRTTKLLTITFLCLVLVTEGKIVPISLLDPPPIPTLYQKIAQDKNNYAILEIPFGFRNAIYESTGSQKNDMSFYFQTVHKKPIIGGYMSMIDEKTWKYFYEDSVIDKLINCQEKNQCEPMDDEEIQKFNNLYNIGYITLLKHTYMHVIVYLRQSFNLQKMYEDDTVTIWRNNSCRGLDSSMVEK